MLRRSVRAAVLPTAAKRFAGTASELKGPANAQVLDQLVGHYINTQSRKLFYKDCLRMEHQAVRWAFSDVRKNSESLARGFTETSIMPGGRVLCIQPDNVEALMIQYACAKVGAMCVVMLHQNITADLLRVYLNQFQPTTLIGREWLTVPETKGGQAVERNLHLWDAMYNVIPELGLAIPGEHSNFSFSTEFPFLERCLVTDHNVNLIGCHTLRRMNVFKPCGYFENPLRRYSRMLHPDDPILCVKNTTPSVEDKDCVVYTHRNCTNAGYLFAQAMGLKAEHRFMLLPNHHESAIGAAICPYASLTSGAVMVTANDNLFTDEHVITVIEKMAVEEVRGVVGKLADLQLLLKHAPNFDDDQFENLQWVALFEDASEPRAPMEILQKIADTLKVADVHVFRGPAEASYMVSQRSLKKPQEVMCAHTELKVVGDRGTTDAKVLSKNTRGNLRLKGPHVTPLYYSNAGLVTEVVDDKGWVSTSLEGVVDDKDVLTLKSTEIY